MNLDRAIVDAAAAKNSFSGVVTIDEADERTFSSTYGFAHRGYGVENGAS